MDTLNNLRTALVLCLARLFPGLRFIATTSPGILAQLALKLSASESEPLLSSSLHGLGCHWRAGATQAWPRSLARYCRAVTKLAATDEARPWGCSGSEKPTWASSARAWGSTSVALETRMYSRSMPRRCRDQAAAAACAQRVESAGSSSCARVQSWKARLTLREETPASRGAPAASASAGAASAAQWIPCLGDEACWSRNLADPAFSGWSWLEPCEGDRGDLAPRSSRRFAAA